MILIYVDDILIAATDAEDGENFLKQLMDISKIAMTGRILALKRDVLSLLGRTIYREREGNLR